MRIYVFLACINMLRISIIAGIFTHFLRIVHDHLVMKFTYFRFRMYIVQFLDIKITHSESLFQLHTVLPAKARDHGGCDHKVILQINHRIP